MNQLALTLMTLMALVCILAVLDMRRACRKVIADVQRQYLARIREAFKAGVLDGVKHADTIRYLQGKQEDERNTDTKGL